MTGDSTTQDLSNTNRAGAFTFATLFSLESLTRSLNSTVLSVQAYDLLGSSQRVSILSVIVSICVLITTLMLPFVLGNLRRRWTYTIGCCLMMVACILLASYTVVGQAFGVFLRNTGASILNVTLSLYIMDNIRKADLAKTEPIRLTLSTFSWVIGPYAGIWLYDNLGHWTPQLASSIMAVILLTVFWKFRLSGENTMPPGKYGRADPVANVARFTEQPRLRLAWAIAFGRSCFWSTLFIYGPVLMIEGGLGKQLGGFLISASQVVLLFAFVYGRIAQSIGIRSVISLCFVMIAVTSIGAGLAGSVQPGAAALLLLLGSFFATGLDAVGGIPFMRAVRFAERQRMASVYRTFLECSELIPGALFAIALLFFPTSAVFIIMGASMILLAVVCWRYLPQSM
jgi:MFS family permease